MVIRAVLFDFHGVLTESPWGAIAAAGGDNDHADVLSLMMGDYGADTDHAWHRLERGEISLHDYVEDLIARADDAGVEIDFQKLQSFNDHLQVRAAVVDRIRQLKAAGYRTAVITNNVRELGSHWRSLVDLDPLFDAVVDSCEVGMRKPNPAIYLHALDQLGGVPPAEAVFLDDHPANVAGARGAGLHGIFVEEPGEALRELDALLAAG